MAQNLDSSYKPLKLSAIDLSGFFGNRAKDAKNLSNSIEIRMKWIGEPIQCPAANDLVRVMQCTLDYCVITFFPLPGQTWVVSNGPNNSGPDKPQCFTEYVQVLEYILKRWY